MGRFVDVYDVLDLFGCSDEDINARATIEEAIGSGELWYVDIADTNLNYLALKELERNRFNN